MQEIKEEWRDIPGYEGYYQVSNLGRVKSLDRIVHFKANHRNKAYDKFKKGHYMYQHKNKDGYMTVSLSINGKVKTWLVHRLVAKMFIPNPYNAPDINHIDGVKDNNCIDNLEWCTKKENMAHAFSHGLVGYSNPSNKKKVKISLSNGFEKVFECVEYAAKYIGVCASGVSRACSGVRPHAGGYKCEFV